MRFISKYKNFIEVQNNLQKIPLRILKFNRPKWQKIQKKLTYNLLERTKLNPYFGLKQYKKRFNYVKKLLKFSKWNILRNLLIIAREKRKKMKRRTILKQNKKSDLTITNTLLLKKPRYWGRIKSSYRNSVKLKRNLYSLFDNSVTNSFFKKSLALKKNFSTEEIIRICLLKLEFRLDILLWRLNFFSSSFQARQSISENEIIINNKKVLGNIFLKKGDIIYFNTSKSLTQFKINNFLNNYSINEVFQTFIEVDYYSKTIVIIKDFKDLNVEDLNILMPKHFDIKKFLYFMK